MCGICGIFNYDGSPVEQKLLGAMNDSMVLRGPDDAGMLIDNAFGMGMRRLSIIDVGGGHQPISNEDHTIHVVLNGEIYNYLELRKDLENIGHRFSTESDTEVLVHLYEEYGIESVKYLNGMFAFALWDSKQKRLWLVRDRLGIKPLVYFEHSGGLVFASSLLALAQHPAFSKEVDRDSLLLYFSLAYVPTPRTIWKQARKLKPGYWMLVEGERYETRKYWDPEGSQRSTVFNANEFVEETKALLQHSIELHSRSDVPVGTFLSGGIDSSAVTALFCNRTEQAVHTFTMDFEGKPNNEGKFARMVAEKHHTKHHAHSLSFEVAIDELSQLLQLMDEPMADSAIVPSFLLSKAAQEHGIKVVLCGAGGDELFGGYHRHYSGKRDQLAGTLSFVPLELWRKLAGLLGGRLSHYGALSWDSGVSFGIGTSGVQLGFYATLLNHSVDFHTSLELTKAQFARKKEFEERNGASYGKMLTDVHHYLVDNVLALTDRTSMAASVEARVPLLDHRLVELVFSTNPEWNLNRHFNDSKRSLKKAVKSYLPSELLKLPKTGFNAPVMEWFNQENQSIKNRVLQPRSDLLQEIFNTKALARIWNNPVFRRGASETLFMIYVADLWLEQHA